MAGDVPTPSGRFLFSVNLLFASQIANYSLRFFLGILLARGLGPELRGDYALFVLSASLAASVGTLGAGLGSMYHIGKSRHSIRVLLGNSQFLVLIASVVGLLVTVGIGLTLDPEAFVSGSSFWLYILAFPAVLEFMLLTALLVGQGRFVGLNTAMVSQTAIVLGGTAILYVIDELTLFRVLAIWGASYVAGGLIALAFLGFEHWNLRAAFKPDLTALKEQVGTGLPGQAGNVLQFLNYRLDLFVVAALATRADVGMYAVAVGLAETVWWIANAVALALLPRLTRMDADKGAAVASVACRNTLAVAAVAAAAVGGVSSVAVRLLFGDAFSPATQAILWLMPGIVALSGAKVISSYIFSQGKMAVNSLIAMVALGGTLVFDVLLIPRFGINGAAAASSIAYVMSLVLALGYYQRLSGNSALDCLLPRPSDLGLYFDLVRRALRRVSIIALAGPGGGVEGR